MIFLNFSHHHSDNTSGKTSTYSTPPPYSRTPSANGWDNSLMQVGQQKTNYAYHYTLGDDGLIPLKSDMQERLWQIIEEHRVILLFLLFLNSFSFVNLLHFREKKKLYKGNFTLIGKL